MAENVEYDSAEKFKEKLETVKESFFPKTKSEIAENSSVDSVAANEPAVSLVDNRMLWLHTLPLLQKTLSMVKLSNHILMVTKFLNN